jgi:hypothetical protein
VVYFNTPYNAPLPTDSTTILGHEIGHAARTKTRFEISLDYPVVLLTHRKINMPSSFLFLLILSWLAPASSITAIAEECGNIAYIPFDAELYTPESEFSILKRAFYKKQINKKLLESALTKIWTTDSNLGHDKKNTRALIQFSDETYYIDRYGVIRNREKYSTIEISKIEEALTSTCQNITQ